MSKLELLDLLFDLRVLAEKVRDLVGIVDSEVFQDLEPDPLLVKVQVARFVPLMAVVSDLAVDLDEGLQSLHKDLESGWGMDV